MNLELEKGKVIATRPHKTVYHCGDMVVKVFNENHPKADVFNEALNNARVEATGLNVPKVLEVGKVGEKWAIASEYIKGNTLQDLMKKNPEKKDEYLELFVDLQIEVHSKKQPQLPKLKDKLIRQIDSLYDELDATTRYELHTRLDGMPKHTKVCHGDFNPTNVIINEDGAFILDWSHATQGNASADAAMTYLLFTLESEELAEKYLDLFCKKSDISKQYVQQWLPIVAAAQMTKRKDSEKKFLSHWIDVMEYQ